MGLSEARMRKLMEGRGPERPGVAGKVAALVTAIGDGDWCEQQASLMRGLALGVLDPHGERYRLAQAHREQCPACRAYVRSLRGLAAVLPPLPALAQWVLDSARGAPPAGGAPAHGAGSLHTGLTSATGSAGAAAPLPAAAGAGAAGTGMGAGAAGGGWLVAGGAATKLAVGCLLAVGLSAGCAALELGPVGHARPAVRGHRVEHAAASAARYRHATALTIARAPVRDQQKAGGAPDVAQGLSPAARASHEFGPEQPPGAAGDAATVARARGASAVHAVVASTPGTVAPATAAGEGTPDGGGWGVGTSSAARTGDGSRAAQREFGIG